MRRAVSVVRLAPSLIWRSQQNYYIMFYDTVVLVLLGHKIQRRIQLGGVCRFELILRRYESGVGKSASRERDL
jgi:hypothetical protein